MAALFIGSSGFSYREWKGSFYPADLPPREYLRYYAERLPSVEVNATFHNLPSEQSVLSWAEQTPPAFRFAVKLSRVIADGGRVERADAFCRRMRLLGERLGPILVQLERPRDDGFLQLLRDSLDPDLSYVWELRHPSWEGVEGLQRIDAEDGDERFRYFRLRETPYGEEALASVAARLRPLLDGGLDVYCYVNKGDAADHSPGGEPTAVTAMRLRGLLAGT